MGSRERVRVGEVGKEILGDITRGRNEGTRETLAVKRGGGEFRIITWLLDCYND